MNLRKVGVFLGLLSLLIARQVYAIGLGEIKLNSALNQELNAEIQITNAGELSENELLVSLGSNQDFELAGIDREFILTGLVFQVDLSAPRNPIIRVSSRQPIEEPYLDFIVVLQWPSGRLLREYTLLLDLPAFVTNDKTAKAVDVPTATSSRQNYPEQYSGPVAGESYTVQGGDTLWRIASQARPPGYSVHQTMNALHSLNPSAFINGDIDLLKKGAILRLPEGSQIEALGESSPAHSVLGMSSQTPETDDDALSSMDEEDEFSMEEPRQSQPETSQEKPAEGRLKLAAAPADENNRENVSTDQIFSENEEGQALTGNADAIQEELSRTQRENEELKARLASLEEQLDTMNRMVELNSETATTLQNAPSQESRPAVSKEKKPDSGSMAWWLYLLIALLVAVLAAFLLLRGRGRKPKEDEYLVEPGYTPAPGKLSETEDNTAAFSAYAEDADELIEQDTDIAESLELSDEEDIDAVEQASIYISLGNFDEAELILKDALEGSPDNAELLVKLMEIYAERGDRDNFEIQRAKLFELNDPVAEAKASRLSAEMQESEAGFAGELEDRDELLDGPEEEAPEQTEVTLDREPEEEVDLAQLSSDIDELDQQFSEAEPGTTELDLSGDISLEDIPEDFLESTEQASEKNQDFFEQEAEGSGEPESEDYLEDLESIEEESAPSAEELSSLNVLDMDEPLETDEIESGPDERTDEVINAEEECATKLELAQAYIDMGDREGAKEMLQEVLKDGGEAQQKEASELLSQL